MMNDPLNANNTADPLSVPSSTSSQLNRETSTDSAAAFSVDLGDDDEFNFDGFAIDADDEDEDDPHVDPHDDMMDNPEFDLNLDGVVISSTGSSTHSASSHSPAIADANAEPKERTSTHDTSLPKSQSNGAFTTSNQSHPLLDLGTPGAATPNSNASSSAATNAGGGGGGARQWLGGISSLNAFDATSAAQTSFSAFKVSANNIAAKASAAANSLNQHIQDIEHTFVVPATATPGSNLNSNGSNNNSSGNLTAAGPKSAASFSSSASTSAAATVAVAPNPETQHRLLTSALGGSALLPGEKIIMFLSNVYNVADSQSSVSGVAGSRRRNRNGNGGNGGGNSSNAESEDAVVWCAAMTFYRVVLLSYRRDELQQQQPPNGGSSSSAAGIDNAVQRAGLTRQWQHHHSHTASSSQKVLQIPLACIDRVEKGMFDPTNGTVVPLDKNQKDARGTGNGNGMANDEGMTVILHSRDCHGRWMRFTTSSYADSYRAHEALTTYAFPGRRNLGYLFAFETCREQQALMLPQTSIFNGTQHPPLTPFRFDSVSEFTRQGIHDSKVWAITHANRDYRVAPSYPSTLVVPYPAAEEKTGDAGLRLLRQTASFRSEGRLPVCTWGNGTDAASIWRCSQPKVGLQGNRSSADEAFTLHIAKAVGITRIGADGKCAARLPSSYSRLLTGSTTADGDTLSVANQRQFATTIDSTAATINTTITSPGGTASTTTSSRQVQVQIPLLKILDCRPKTAALANRGAGYGYESTSNYPHCELTFYNIQNIHAVRDAALRLTNLVQSPTSNDLDFSSKTEDTKWLGITRNVLNNAWHTAAYVHFHRLPVMVHCSHGWDRTSQVCALAQIFLDPYFRTQRGFATLVEKDFMSFGHPFHTRCGHGESRGGDGNGSQRCPIFLQFLDAVYQLVNQYPSQFAFTSRFLLAISDHIYSCRFGNLLCDSEMERTKAQIPNRTTCLWTFLERYQQEFVNVGYDATAVHTVLMPPLPSLLRRVTLWSDYFCRFGPKSYAVCLRKELVPFVLPSSVIPVGGRGGGHTGNDEELQRRQQTRAQQLEDTFCASDEQSATVHRLMNEMNRLKEEVHLQTQEIKLLRERLVEPNTGAAVASSSSDDDGVTNEEELKANDFVEIVKKDADGDK